MSCRVNTHILSLCLSVPICAVGIIIEPIHGVVGRAKHVDLYSHWHVLRTLQCLLLLRLSLISTAHCEMGTAGEVLHGGAECAVFGPRHWSTL